jgi:hypothetical protein
VVLVAVGESIKSVQENKNIVLYIFQYFQVVHVQEQLSFSRAESQAMAKSVRALQEADIQRQRREQLDQKEMERNKQELHKAQSLQVTIYLIMALVRQTF